MNHVPDILAILAYHRVGTPPRHARYKGQYVTPFQLRLHVTHLQRARFRFMTLAEAVRAKGLRAVVTFDDGYRNNLELGLPTLSRINIPATVFVITEDVGKQGLTWEEAGETNPSDLLSWQELRLLKENGWEIGSHCSQHVHLARREELEQLILLRKSREDLVRELGPGPYALAYPFGSYDLRSLRSAQCAGFYCAVTTKRGVNSAITPLYELARLHMKGFRLDHMLRVGSWLKPALSCLP